MEALSPVSHLHSETIAPTVPQRACMPSLEEVLCALAENGRVMHIQIAPSRGEWQASFREPGGSGYRIVIKKNIVEALLAAIGPKVGQSWEEHLAAPPSPKEAPKTKDLKRRQKLREEQPFPDDIEDLL
jgi:hypothetical protein